MSNNIENRIVEMRFDNAQFEAAVAKTMDTLDKFKEKLNFRGNEKGLDNLGKATSNYNYTLNDIGQSLDQLNSRFSTFGRVGEAVIHNLTNRVVDFAANGLGKLTSGITQGGLSRAMNLEQAKFQMQGIYKDAQKVYDIIYDAILPELMGTPYSLDQAAVVIGQLGASGIQSAEQVKQATRAISGLAAMSGRGFDEVGRVFSKVAGQGALMGGELQQLSTYGINAAANIKDYFIAVEKGNAEASDAVKQSIADIIDAYGALDEAAIRDAASERLINYEAMASAFDYMYGPHAKKSTEMYTGALEDLKAALARIGAEPAAVGLEFLRNAFNALVPAVDAVNAVLKPFTSATKQVVKSSTGEKIFGGDVAGSTAKKVQSLGIAFSNLFVKMDQNGTIARYTAKDISALQKEVENAGDSVEEWKKKLAGSVSEGDAIMNPGMWRIITASTESFVNILGAVGKALHAIGQGFRDAMPKVTLTMVAKVVEGFRDMTKALSLSEENLGRLRLLSATIFTPLGLAVRIVATAFKVFSSILQAVFGALQPIGNAIGAIAGAFGKIGSNVRSFIDNIGDGASRIGAFVTALLGAIAHFLHLDKLLQLVQSGFGHLANIFGLISDKVGSFISNFTSNVYGIARSAYEFLNLGKAIELIRSGISKFRSGIVSALHLDELGSSLKGLKNTVADFFSQNNFLQKFIENLKSLLEWLKELIPFEEIIDKVGIAFGKFVDKTRELTAGGASRVQGWIEKLKTNFGDLFQAFKDTNLGQVIAKQLIKPFAILKGQTKWIDAFKDVLSGIGTIALSTLGFDSFGDALQAAGDKIKGFLEAFGRFIGLLGEVGKSKSASAVDKVGKSLKSAFNSETAANMKGFGEALGGIAGKAGSGLSNIGKALSSLFESFDVEAAKKFLRGVGVFIVAIAYVKTLRDFMGVIKSFGNVADSIGSLWGIKSINTAIANTIKMVGLASALVLFAVAVKILTTIPWKQMAAGAAIILVALGAFFLILKHIDKIAVDTQQSMKITALALAMGTVAASLTLLCAAIKTLGGMPIEQMVQGIAGVAVLLTFLALLANFLGGSEGLKADNAKDLAKAAFGLIAIAKGIQMLVEPISALGQMPWPEMVRGALAVAGLITVFSLFAFAIKANAKVFSAALGMIALAGAVMLMCKAIRSMSQAYNEGDLVPGILIIAGLFAAFSIFAAVAGHAKSSIFNAAAGMLALGKSISLIAKALVEISSVTSGFDQAIYTLTAIFIAFAMFAAIAKGSAMNAGIGMLAMAAAIAVLTAAIQQLSELSFDKFLSGFLKMAAVTTVLIVALWALQKVIKGFSLDDSVTIIALGAAVLALSVSLALLASIPIISLVGALMVLAGAIAVVGGLLLLFSSVSVGLLVTAAAFAVLGIACLMVGGGMMLLVVALTSLIPLILMLATTDLTTLNAGLNVLLTVAGGLKDALLILSVGALAFGGSLLVLGAGLLVAAVGLAAVGAAALIASIGIMTLIGTISLLSAGLSLFTGKGLLEGLKSGFAGIKENLKSSLVSLFTGGSQTAQNEAKKVGENYWTTASDTMSSESTKKSSGIEDAMASPFDNFLSGKMPDFISQSGVSTDELMNTMAGSISNGEGGIASSTDGALGAMDGIISEKQFDALMGGQEIGDALGSGLGNVDLSGVSSRLGSSAISGVSGRAGEARVAGALLSGNTVQGFSSQTSGGTAAGQKAGSLFVSGVSSKTGSARSAGSSLGSAANSGAGSISLYSEGQDAGSGYVSGVKDKWGAAYNAGYSLGQAAKQGTKDAQNSNSPAKEFIKFGKDAVEGYVIGLKSMPNEIINAARGIADTGLETLSNMINTISSAMDSELDLNPTITPVVDLTKVNESANQISGYFNSASVGLDNQLMGNLSAVSNSFRTNPNDLLNRNLTTLTNTLNGMTESMNSRSLNNYITVDGSADPEAFADGLIRSFKLNARTV